MSYSTYWSYPYSVALLNVCLVGECALAPGRPDPLKGVYELPHGGEPEGGEGGTESESVGVEIAVGVRERGEQRDGSATDAVMSLQSQLQLNFHLPHPFLGRKIQRGATLLRGVHHAFKYLMTI